MTEETQAIEKSEETPKPEGVTLAQAVEEMAAIVGKIAKKTKTSETTVLSIWNFQWQEIERDRMRKEAEELRLGQGQQAIDAVAAEAAERREADEVIG
jgi:hypothetical protein